MASVFSGEETQEKTIKLVVIGDGAVGKTSALMTYVGKALTGYTPTVFDNYSCAVKINDQVQRIQLWDTAGQEAFDKLRSLCTVFILYNAILISEDY